MSAAEPPAQVPGYAVEDRLASDPGELRPPIYRAQHRDSGERVVLAHLPHDLEPGRRERTFERVQHIVQLSAPAFPPLFDLDSGIGGGLVVWYAEAGETLRERLRRGPLEIAPAVHLAASLCRALGPLHAAGLAHAALRPATVLLTPAGDVRLLAAGLDALGDPRPEELDADPGAAAAAYLAPEQLRSPAAAGPACDLWALGILVHEMLDGELPFAGNSYRQMATAILTLDPLPLGTVPGLVPYELERLADWALARTPEERYGSVGEMLVDLEALERQLRPRTLPSATTRETRSRAGVRERIPESLESAAGWLGEKRQAFDLAPGPSGWQLYLLPGLVLLLLLALFLWCRFV